MQHLSVRKRLSDGATVLDLEGRLVHENKGALKSELEKLAHPVKLILNMEKLDYVDSSGIGTIIAAFTEATSKGGKFALLKPVERVRKVLHQMYIDSVLASYSDEEAAVQALADGKTGQAGAE